MAAQQVGSLYLELFLDPSRYYAQIEEAEKRARDMAARIERNWKMAPITPQVDDRQLTNLNRHLDIKQRHYSQVKTFIENNPIKLKVDSSELNKIKAPAQKAVNIDVIYKVKGAVPSQLKDSTITIDARFDKSGAKAFTTEIGNELEKAGEKVAKGIKKSTKHVSSSGGGIFGAITAIPQTIARGFYEGVGITYSQQLTSGFIKGIEGKFGKTLENVGQMTSEKFLKAGKVGGDVLLKRLGIPEGTAGVKARVDKINNVLQDLFPADIIENKLGRVEKRIDKLLDSLIGLKSGAENLGNLAALGNEIAGLGQIPFEKLKADRAKAISSIASQIRADQKQNPIKLDIPQESERVVFAVGGFAGQKGQSANNFVAKKLGMLLGDKSAVVPVANPYSDVSASVGDIGALKWSTEAAFKTLKTPVRQKVNPDAVSMARQAYAAYQQDPAKPIRLAGYSYGGQVANDALEILQALGVRDVKAVGIGSPSFGKLSNSKREDFAVTLGKGDGVKRLQDIGAAFAGQGRNLNITPVQGHELSSYLADPKSQEIILRQIEGANAKARKDLQNPDAFRLVDYQQNIEKMMQGLEGLLTNPVGDSALQKQLMGANLEAIKSTKADLEEALRGLSENVAKNIEEHHQALIEAENVLSELLGIQSPQQQAPNTEVEEQTKKALKQRQELEQLMLSLNKKDIVEPIAKEFGIKDVRNIKKQDLINKVLDVADPSTLKSFLPYTTPPSQEAVAASQANLQMPVNALKSHLKTQRDKIQQMMSVNTGAKSGSQLIDISSAIEREYQTIILSLSQGVSGGAKKVLEAAKLEIGQLRAKALREATEQTNKQSVRATSGATVGQGVSELARINSAAEENFFQKITSNFTQRAQRNIQSNYQRLIKSVAKESGARFDKSNLPKLIVDDDRLNKLGVSALYNFQKNQIVISKQVEDILKKSPQSLIKYQEKLKDIVHEARHAFQFDFGRLGLNDLVQGAKSPINFIPQSQLSSKAALFGQKSAELANRRAGGNLDPSFLKTLQSVEGDAYGFEEKTENIVKNAAKMAAPFKSALSNLKEFTSGLNQARSEVSGFADFGIELFRQFAESLPNGAALVHFAENLGVAKGAIVPLIKTLAGFAVLATVINLFRDFASESLKVAANLEALEKRVQFASGGQEQGNVAFNALRSQSERFGVNRQATLEQGAGFLAVTRDTPIEGERSLKVLESLNQASRVYNLTIEQQGRAQVALQQIVSKGVVSQEELRGQLSEAIPGAAQVAARAYGVTVQELNRMISAGLDGAEFVQKFSAQLGNETAGGLAGALNTTQARTAKFENSLLNLQESVGKALLPLQNVALSGLTTALDLLNKSLPILLTLLAALAVRVSILGAQALGQLVTQLIASRAAMFALGTAAQTVGNVILTSFKQFAVFAVIGVSINALINKFRDLSGELRGQIDAVKDLQNKYDELINTGAKRPRQIDDVKVLGDRIKRAIPDLVTGKGKEIEDSIKAIQDSRKLTPELINTSKSAEAQKYIEQIRGIDKEIERINIKRRALVVTNPGDADGLRNLRNQEKELIQQRSQLEKVPDNIKQQLQAQADSVKSQLEYLQRLKKDYPLYGAEVEGVNRGIAKLNQDYEDIVKAQTELNKAIGKGSDAFSNLRKNVQAVADDLADAMDRITISTNQAKIAFYEQSKNQNLSSEQEKTIGALIEKDQLENILKQRVSAVSQTRALLNTDENQLRMRSFGISENTGRARLGTLAENANPQDKFLFEQLASLQQQKLEISNLQVQIAQARTAAQKELIDLTKQVADYYRGIERNAQQQTIEMQRLSNQIQVTQQQNKLRSALLDGYDTIVSQFIDSIIDSIGQFNQVGDRALEAQSQLLNNRFNLEDTLRSGSELSRKLPTLPIKLDFSSIPADNDVTELGRQVNEAVNGSNDLAESITGATNNADELYKQLLENINPINDANKQLTDTNNNFENVNQKAEKTGELTKQFGGELTNIPSQVAAIDQGFIGVVASLGTVIAKTVEWLGNLGGAKESLEAIGNNIGKQPLFQGLQQIGQGILQSGTYGIASPSTTQSLEQVLKGSVSEGQGFFGRRARGNHASIDFDGTEGLGGGAKFQAMFPGRVASTRAWGNGYRDVDGGNSNAIRIVSQLPGGLGEFTTDYGHYKTNTAKVQEGQSINAGTLLGALSQKDSISSGGHLDLKIRIPSSIANQFKTTQSAGGGQSFVEVKEFMKWYQSQLGNASTKQTLPTSGANIPAQNFTRPAGINAASIARNNNLQSLLVTDANGRAVSGFNSSKAPNSPASTIKLVLADVVTDRLNPNQQVKINRGAIGQYEDKFKAGQTASVSTLLKEMLGNSNNTAFNALVQALGGTKSANNFIKAKGYGGTELNSLLSIPGASGRNISNANDTSRAMLSLLNGTMPGDKVAEEALRSTRNFKYQGETGGKIGNNSKVVGNVGIVNINGSEYIVTAYANVDGNKINNRKLITNATNEVRKGLMSGASTTQPIEAQNGISRGGNALAPAELARLTEQGRQLYQLQRHPNVLAFADVVARAEGTDFRNNSKNFGYSMMIGGEHDTDFSRHPFAGNSGSRIRAPRHNSTASGRYQMMDFNYSRTQAERQFGRGAKSDLATVFQGENPGSFSPGVQDLYFTASLKSRGILDEVLAGNFEAALKNPQIAKHYASLQSGAGRSAYKGQGTPEGQLRNTIPFAQQRAAARRAQGVTTAASNFTAATPSQLLQGTGAGMQLATQTAQNQQNIINQQSEADQERARQQAVRSANQALRQYERGRRDQSDRAVTNQRGVTDFGISSIKNPSPEQRRLQESTQIKRQTDDLIKERERDIESRQKQIEQSRDALSRTDFNAMPNGAQIKSQLEQGIKENETEIPKLQKQIQEIRKIGADYQKNVEKIFAREDNLRRQTASFELEQGEIAKLQKQLEGLQQLQQVAPLDPKVFDIPQLQEEIELKQAALDLDRSIADEEAKLYRFTINQQEFDRKVESLKKENIARQENAMARRQQAEAEQELQKVQRQLEVKAQFTSLNNEYLQNTMQLRQLGQGGRNPLDIQREMQLAQMDSDFAQREFEARTNKNRTPEERDAALESLRQIRQSRTDVVNAELARSQEDNQIAARDLFNKSNLDVVAGQASRFKTFGQDNRAKQLEKGMAIFQQNTAFQDQIRELERLAQTNEEVAKSADLIRANYEELNKIKLDEIENQFNEFLPAIQEIKGATQGLFSDLLSGADDAFANFGKKILDYFTQLAAQMLTNDLFGAIGGAFGMKGQQSGGGGGAMFDLIGGLLGGLFYDGGYVPNYAKGYNPLQDALKREHAQTGKRAYVAVLSEGERVLNLNETRKFNSMGGDRILRMADGGVVGASSSFSPSTSGGNVSVNNNITIGGNGDNMDVGAFRTVLDGRIREIISQEQRPGRSLNRKRR